LHRYTAFGETYNERCELFAPDGGECAAGAVEGEVVGFSANEGASDELDLYDSRAGWWCPQLGSFFSVDEFAFANINNTLWGWSNQNPIAYADLTGHDGTTDNPVQGLLNGGWLPGGLTAFGLGMQQRANGISEMPRCSCRLDKERIEDGVS
jgi:hypothetical protein